MSKFDQIRPFYDHEVQDAIADVIHNPMMIALMNFTFPDTESKVWLDGLKKINSIYDFQTVFVYKSILKVLEKSSEGLTSSGFEKLDKNTSYLFISNHRDIILDTSLLNVCLYEHGLIMTASAIGDNLVKKKFLNVLSKLNRNFVIKRGLSPKELLESSKLVSDYISELILYQNRSVWIAQREGRTKDGNDSTHQGVLKMLFMACQDRSFADYFKRLKIVPVSISYEYDPTDVLKMSRILAEANDLTYVKDKNEDFITLLSGVIGQKKRIHIHIGDLLDSEVDKIESTFDNLNKQIQALAQIIDKRILTHYKLWPTNYIAYDLLHKTETYSTMYSEKDKVLFEKRLEKKINRDDIIAYESFLRMYANPVINKIKYNS